MSEKYLSMRVGNVDEGKGLREINNMKVIAQCRIYMQEISKVLEIEEDTTPYLLARVVVDVSQKSNNTYGVAYSLCLTPKNVKFKKDFSPASLPLNKKRVEELLEKNRGMIAELVQEHDAFVQKAIDESMPKKLASEAQSGAIGEAAKPGKPGKKKPPL